MVALLVILTIVLALAIDSFVLARQRRTASVEALQPIVAMKVPQPPQGVFLDTAHTWLRITSDGRLRVGIDDFLAEAVGQVDKVEVPAQGTTIERGSPGPVVISSTDVRLRHFATVFGLIARSRLSVASEACDCCITARVACVVVAAHDVPVP